MSIETKIIEIVKDAINGKTIQSEIIKKLDEEGILENSTTLRMCQLYPGEAKILHYDFIDGEERFVGFLGFDKHSNLISIDERLPKANSKYFGKLKFKKQ